MAIKTQRNESEKKIRNAQMRWILILIAAVQIDQIVCSAICVQDGDELGVWVNSQCYCANKRDLSKIIPRVPKNGAAILNKKTYIWE